MKNYLLIIAVFIALVSCKKDKQDDVTNPTNQNEEELITTFKIVFTDAAGIEPTVEAMFVDLDGPGGNAPTTFDNINLIANTTYNVQITLLNESVSPVENISVEVEEEGVDHLFCFDLTPSLNLTVNLTDLDDNGLPIGLTTQWSTLGSSVGTTTIRLKHQPGIKTGQCDVGQTDIELDFQTIIQ